MDRRERGVDATDAMLAVIRGVKSELWTSLPGIIVSFNADAQTVEVQPAIKALIRGPMGAETWVNLPVLPDVPVVFPSGGGFTLTFPIQPGDECLVVFAARCIDAWWQSGGAQQQIEQRLLDLSDGFCIPGPHSQPRKLSGVSTSDVQLRSDDGSTFVAIQPGGAVQITAPASVTITAPNIMLQGNVTITGTLTQEGDVAITGNTVQTGDITATGAVLGTSLGIPGLNFSTHHHVADHGVNVSQPIPGT